MSRKIGQVLALTAALALLQGCNDSLTDIQQFMESVKANTPAGIPPLPKAKPFVHISYQSANARSPFSAPRPEAVQEQFSQSQDCLSPDPSRRKEPLEKFALDNLAMRGTLGDSNNFWALIEAADKTLHRVSKNNYIGLFHGRIIQVDPNQIELIELIPDGAGCWIERTTTMQMADPNAATRK
jgi:type IV pilus assembly protein PilP